MNRAYDVRETRRIWRRYILALALTVLSATVLLISVVPFVGAQVFGQQIASGLGLQGVYRSLMDIAIWLLVVSLLLPGTAFRYWAAAHSQLKTAWVLPGAAFFAAGWLLATYLYERGRPRGSLW